MSFIIDYERPNEGKRSERFKCFDRMMQRFAFLKVNGWNPVWRKE